MREKRLPSEAASAEVGTRLNMMVNGEGFWIEYEDKITFRSSQ